MRLAHTLCDDDVRYGWCAGRTRTAGHVRHLRHGPIDPRVRSGHQALPPPPTHLRTIGSDGPLVPVETYFGESEA